MENVIALIKEKLNANIVNRITDKEVVTMGLEFHIYWEKDGVTSPKVTIEIEAKTLLKASSEEEIVGLSKLLDDMHSYLEKTNSYFSKDPKFCKCWVR
jgi:hypothetical protein